MTLHSVEWFVGRFLALRGFSSEDNDDNNDVDAPATRLRGAALVTRFLQRILMSTLLGGFHFDPYASLWHNTVHMYLFLALCFVPFTLFLIFGKTTYIGFGLYILFTLTVLVPLKVLNHWLQFNIDAPIEPKLPPWPPAAPAGSVTTPVATNAEASSEPVQMGPEAIAIAPPVAATASSSMTAGIALSSSSSQPLVGSTSGTRRSNSGAAANEGGESTRSRSNASNKQQRTVNFAAGVETTELDEIDISGITAATAVTSSTSTVDTTSKESVDVSTVPVTGNELTTQSAMELRLARDENDTGEGVVHTFVDENGEVQHYVFHDASVNPLRESDEVDNRRISVIVQDLIQQQSLSRAVSAAATPVTPVTPSSLHARTSMDSLTQRGSSSNEGRTRRHRLLRQELSSTTTTDSSPALPSSPNYDLEGSSVAQDSVEVERTTSSMPAGPVSSEEDTVKADKNKRKPVLSSFFGPKNNKKSKKTKIPRRPLKHYLVYWSEMCNYKMRKLFPDTLSRLTLELLFDRTHFWSEVFLSVFFMLSVTLLSYQIYSYYDFTTPMFFLSIVMGSAHFALLKSPQPDAASSLHYNRLSSYSRALYVSLFAAVILVLHACAVLPDSQTPRYFYAIHFSFANILTVVEYIMLILILCLPLLHLMSLLPQLNTLANHVTEQWLMHIMGSTATQSVTAAIVELVKSIVLLVPAYFVCYGVFNSTMASQSLMATKGFAIYSAMLMAASYYLAAIEWIQPDGWMTLFVRVKKASKAKKSNWLRELLIDSTETPSIPWLLYDSVATLIIILLVFLLHLSVVFNNTITLAVFSSLALFCAFLTLVIIPQLRRPFPFSFVAEPILTPAEYGRFEVSGHAKITWFEQATMVLVGLQKFLFFPVVTICMVSLSADYLRARFGVWLGAFVLTIAGGKLGRMCFTDYNTFAYTLPFALMLFNYELSSVSESIVLDTFLISIFVPKIKEAMLKLSFYIVYTAPWNTMWASLFHVLMHPLSLPHAALILLQILISSLVSAPFYPLNGSAAFLMAYMRPVRFWERHYKTNRLKDDNLRLADSLDRSAAASTLNNLNSIFYEHICKTLSETLYDDIQLGRYGSDVENGDTFILVNDKLTSILHIVQLGNGFVTFQLRGLEFKGTYCQERELEAISEDTATNNERILCFRHAHQLESLLSLNAWWGLRWKTWEVLNQSTILQTYSISLNQASTMFYAYSLRQILVKFLVMSVIHFLIDSPQLEQWLENTFVLIRSMLFSLPSLFANRAISVSGTF